MAVGDLADGDDAEHATSGDVPADSAADPSHAAPLHPHVEAEPVASSAVVPPPPPAFDPDRPPRSSVEPSLPYTPAQPSPSTLVVPDASTAPPSWTRPLHFRTDEERNRSVYRRANPWYRQLARGVVALSLLGGLGVGIYFGVQATQDWFDRPRLPAAGPEVPAFRTTSFQIRSNAPAPELEGTLTLDTQTRAFEFIGAPSGPQSGQRVVSADGGVAFLRIGDGRWTRLEDNDTLNADLRRATSYLADDTTADAILTNRLRRGYIDLVDEVDEGTGSAQLTRWDMRINTRAFAIDFPLQWQDFENTAIPGVDESGALPISIRVDAENVLVAVTDDTTGWRWQRLTYVNRPPSIINPAESLLEATTGDDVAPDEAAPSTTAPATDG